MIDSWAEFERRVRRGNDNLLATLDKFESPILVAGCQRSGTTVVTRILSQSDGVTGLKIGPDDELDAALVLAGNLEIPLEGRYCFQTTYLNERYVEYYQHSNYKLVWLVRKPESVIFSMLYNWRRGALNRLFTGCGVRYLSENEKKIYDKLGPWFFSRINMACLSYKAKIAQLEDMTQKLNCGRFVSVDYDDLISNKESLLPRIFEFLGVEFKDEYLHKLHSKSITKSNRMSDKYKKIIKDMCDDDYHKARRLLSIN